MRTTSGEGSAAEYLHERMNEEGVFRYLGYGGVGHPDGGRHARSYMDRRFDPHVLAILTNGRPMFLDLYEAQGHDPIQLERYVDVIRAINGKGQDYHTAFVSDEGVDSPLLDLLDVQYLLVDASLPLDRPDVVSLTEGFEEDFRNDRVVVFERGADLPHAWIVHEARRVEPGEALPLIVNGDVDPYRIALVEEPVPAMDPVDDPSADRAVVSHYGADRIAIETETTAPGFLIVSEIYADGWVASVGGEAAEVVPTHHALRRVSIPAGSTTVELRYEPQALRAGFWISGGTAMVMVGMLAVAWRARQHHHEARPVHRKFGPQPPW